MNQRKGLTYILLLAAVAIWGIIGYRIVSGLKTKETNAVEPDKMNAGKISAPETVTVAPLLLNYRDPFLKGNISGSRPVAQSNKHVIQAIRAVTTPVPAAPKEIRWPVITFSGIIENKQKNITVVMLKVDNKDYLLKEKQTAQQVQLLKINKDSVLVSFSKEKRYIRRNIN